MKMRYILGIDFRTEKSTEESSADVRQLIEMIKTNLIETAQEAVKSKSEKILEITIESKLGQ